MSSKSAAPHPAPARVVCARCRRPESVCYCRHLTSIETTTRVVLLQHPRERDVPIGTARMAALCLPNAELHVGVRWSGSAALARALSDPGRPAVLLYPGEGAIDVASHPPPGPVTLVVVDGTWWQARKVIRDNPELSALPRYTFTPKAPSDYRIRKEPDATCVSTIEALVQVLGVLEGERERFEALLAPFRAMVDAQIACAARFRQARTRHERGPRPPRRRLPPSLLARGGDLLCVAGEANAWPYGSSERAAPYAEELVHWLAFRPRTGERFEIVKAPSHLAPMTPVHLALSRTALESGCTGELLRRRWRAFVRDDDVLCSWGTYATTLFAVEGGYLPPVRLDLRQVARVYMDGRFGTLDELLVRLDVGPSPALGGGRGGTRLGQLVRLTRVLEEAAAREEAARAAAS
ncbi:MAG: DTW domain-containing protein [Myxococcales bacterium]|nr:DTW domain-containing protein [Myxococcales bacterium]